MLGKDTKRGLRRGGEGGGELYVVRFVHMLRIYRCWVSPIPLLMKNLPNIGESRAAGNQWTE